MTNPYRKGLIRADSGEFHDAGNRWHSTAAYEHESVTQGVAEAVARAQALDDSSMGVELSPRTYDVSANLTIGAAGVPLHVTPGALLKPPSGYTYTIAGQLTNDPGRQWIDESAGGMVLWGDGATEHVHPDWFGEIDGANDTATLQAAIDNVGGYDEDDRVARRPKILLRNHEYYITQVTVPNNTWVEGVSMFGQGNWYGSRLRQIEGSTVSMVRFDARIGNVGAARFLAHVTLKNLMIYGAVDTDSTTVHGMLFQNPDDDSAIYIGDTCVFENIYIRRIYGDGIRILGGGVPSAFDNIRLFECAGAGIRYIKSGSTANQTVAFESISGDACQDGLIRFEDIDSSDTNPITITLKDIKSEHRVLGSDTITAWAADSTAGWQTSAVVFHSCPGARVSITGLSHHNGGSTDDNVVAAIHITGTGRPKIRFGPVGVTYRSAKARTPVTLLDETVSPNVSVSRSIAFDEYGYSTVGPSYHTITASADNTDVAGLRTLYVNTSGGSVSIGGLKNGVAGQVLAIVKTSSSNALTINHAKGGVTDQTISCVGSRDHVIGGLGGLTLACTTAGTWQVLAAAEPRNSATLSGTETTASVAGVAVLRLGFSGATTFSSMTDPQAGQVVTLIATNANATIDHAFGTNLIALNGSADYVMANNGTLTVRYDINTGRWYEVGRMVP